MLPSRQKRAPVAVIVMLKGKAMTNLPLGAIPQPENERESEQETNRIRDEQSPLSGVSLDSIKFLYQVIMALALTNGVYLFVTKGQGYNYISLSDHSFSDYLIFVIFISTVILFSHGTVIILHQSYGEGYKNQGIKPLVDFFFRFFEAGIFYIMSLTLANLNDSINFFQVMALLLIINVGWSLVTITFDARKPIVTIYAIMNSLTVIIGIVWYETINFK